MNHQTFPPKPNPELDRPPALPFSTWLPIFPNNPLLSCSPAQKRSSGFAGGCPLPAINVGWPKGLPENPNRLLFGYASGFTFFMFARVSLNSPVTGLSLRVSAKGFSAVRPVTCLSLKRVFAIDLSPNRPPPNLLPNRPPAMALSPNRPPAPGLSPNRPPAPGLSAIGLAFFYCYFTSSRPAAGLLSAGTGLPLARAVNSGLSPNRPCTGLSVAAAPATVLNPVKSPPEKRGLGLACSFSVLSLSAPCFNKNDYLAGFCMKGLPLSKLVWDRGYLDGNVGLARLLKRPGFACYFYSFMRVLGATLNTDRIGCPVSLSDYSYSYTVFSCSVKALLPGCGGLTGQFCQWGCYLATVLLFLDNQSCSSSSIISGMCSSLPISLRISREMSDMLWRSWMTPQRVSSPSLSQKDSLPESGTRSMISSPKSTFFKDRSQELDQNYLNPTSFYFWVWAACMILDSFILVIACWLRFFFLVYQGSFLGSFMLGSFWSFWLAFSTIGGLFLTVPFRSVLACPYTYPTSPPKSSKIKAPPLRLTTLSAALPPLPPAIPPEKAAVWAARAGCGAGSGTASNCLSLKMRQRKEATASVRVSVLGCYI